MRSRRIAIIEANTPVLTIAGAFNVRIAGIRFEADGPAEIGVRIAAPAATLDLVEITGPIRRAIDLSPASSLTVRGSRIAVAGTVLALPDEAHATFVNSIFTRAGGTAEAAISATASPNLVLRGNVFSGYGTEVVQGVGAARRSELMAGNIVIPGEPQAPGAAAGSGGRSRGNR